MKARRYVMTARRKVALRKAQLVSARKRRGKKISAGNKKIIRNAALVGGTGVIFGATAYGGKKVGQRRQIKRIDKIVEARWGKNGTEVAKIEVFGKQTATISRNKNVLSNTGNERIKREVQQWKPETFSPNEVDEQIFIRSSYVVRPGKNGRFYNGPYTKEEIHRRKRNRWDWSGNDKHKPITLVEAMRRTDAYVKRMEIAGKKVNSLHRSYVLNQYRKMVDRY